MNLNRMMPKRRNLTLKMTMSANASIRYRMWIRSKWRMWSREKTPWLTWNKRKRPTTWKSPCSSLSNLKWSCATSNTYFSPAAGRRTSQSITSSGLWLLSTTASISSSASPSPCMPSTVWLWENTTFKRSFAARLWTRLTTVFLPKSMRR